MKETVKKPVNGIRIRTFNAVMVLLSSLIFIALIANTLSIPGQYQNLITSTEEYMACELDAATLYQASDYLTEQVRLYVEAMDLSNMQNYFTEANETRRREKALEELQQHETTQYVQDSLSSALQASNDLMIREIYAMKLVSVANGYSEDSLPAEVQAVQLKASDAALKPAEQIELARQMVFDTGYQNAKNLIYTHVDHFLEGLLTTMADRQAASQTALGRQLSYQRVLIFALFIMNIITFAAITILIVRPLTIHVKRIKENGLLEITGSYEFKYLALTYNDIYELNAANQAALESKAVHDPLTGLMNRGGFDELRKVLKSSSAPLALVLADVDTFKQINDTYGHEIGDRVLKRVAFLMSSIFRSSDYVIRQGGDEFAVIMHGMQREYLPILEQKLKSMNEILQKPTDGLPPVSLSVGVALSDQGFPEELYRQADQALYHVKEHGRCGYHIWNPEEEG